MCYQRGGSFSQSTTQSTGGRGTGQCVYGCSKTAYRTVSRSCYSETGCGCNYYYRSARTCGCQAWGEWTTTPCSGNGNQCQSKIEYAMVQPK